MGSWPGIISHEVNHHSVPAGREAIQELLHEACAGTVLQGGSKWHGWWKYEGWVGLRLKEDSVLDEKSMIFF